MRTKTANIITAIIIVLLCLVGFTMAQDTTELKIIKAPTISLDQMNQVPDREHEAISDHTTQIQSHISEAIQDTLESLRDDSHIALTMRIGNENLTAVNKYEALVLKSMSTMHKALAMQRDRGLITQEQYETACLKMIQTFRSAMLQRPLFDKTQG